VKGFTALEDILIINHMKKSLTARSTDH